MVEFDQLRLEEIRSRFKRPTKGELALIIRVIYFSTRENSKNVVVTKLPSKEVNRTGENLVQLNFIKT